MSNDTCPNCGESVENHPKNSCVLAALIELLEDRGNLSKDRLLTLHRDTDVNALWTVLGPVADRLEAGIYSINNGRPTPSPSSLHAVLEDADVTLSDCIAAFATPEDHPAIIHARATLHDPGTLEFGEPTFVSETPNGCYVLAWAWVPYPLQMELLR
jgi:hypothetical protein